LLFCPNEVEGVLVECLYVYMPDLGNVRSWTGEAERDAPSESCVAPSSLHAGRRSDGSNQVGQQQKSIHIASLDGIIKAKRQQVVYSSALLTPLRRSRKPRFWVALGLTLPPNVQPHWQQPFLLVLKFKQLVPHQLGVDRGVKRSTLTRHQLLPKASIHPSTYSSSYEEEDVSFDHPKGTSRRNHKKREHTTHLNDHHNSSSLMVDLLATFLRYISRERILPSHHPSENWCFLPSA
jgi:hypothetical protein